MNKDFLKNTTNWLRSWFPTEFSYRLYVVLELLGLFFLLHMGVVDNDDSWFLLPRNGNYCYHCVFGNYEWSLFDGFQWTHYSHNWWAMVYIFGPFLTAKAVGWLQTAKELDD